MDQTVHGKIQYRLSCMKDRRESFEDHWREIAEYMMPRAYRYLDEAWEKRGNKANKKIIDPAATVYCRAAVASFMSNITPPSRPWKKLRSFGELSDNYEAKTYLEASSEIMDEHILKANFYTEASKLYESVMVFGTGCMLIEEDDETDFRCEVLPVGSYWLGTDHKRRVTEFMREVEMTAYQMAEAFGEENLSETLKSCLKSGNSVHKEVRKVLHYIGENECYCADAPLGGLEYQSIYIDPTDNDKNRVLRRSGYEEFPVVAVRWKATGDDTYGLDCPGMMALGSVKQLQHAQKQLAKAVEKMVSPPTQRPEGTIKKGVDSTPGADNIVTRGAAADGIRPLYQINFDVQAVTMLIQDLRDQIGKIFFYDQFLMVASQRRSGTKAREIEELHDEKMLILASVYEQFSNEFLDPAVSRIYSILNRRGRLPVVPEVLAGREFTIEYVSVMAQAMKLVGIGNMDRALAIMAQTASIDPTSLDLVNMQRFTKQYWERLGVDSRIMSSPDEIAQKEEARAASLQKAQTQQQATVEAETAKMLSETKTDEDNALTQIMGNTL
jgi:hypothetical protein